ncbi:MAG: glutamine synthetase III [Bacteroidales bacterium]|nr:glutamine synthetase III [Bacteroidales bacterium]
MSRLRFDCLEKSFSKAPVVVESPGKPSDFFGCKVFDKPKMYKYLSSAAYAQMEAVMEGEASLEPSVVNEVAEGMKRWALENGATHYTHWFSPLTGTTAEKHDSFIEKDGKSGVIEEFSGKLLSQQEPDASSFPNGGIRSTFEARGYSAWDPTSPAFIMDDVLCIPTVFIAYTGEALDYKAPLLKSVAAVDKAATAVCRLFDKSVHGVTTNVGWEQEYFLVDYDLAMARPDLVMTGRTLMGHEGAKNQQLDDHYFGAIPERVAAFMTDLEIESHKLGIPVKTCHNEVAPNQFEVASIYEKCSLSIDHNMILMSLMKKVARRHGLMVLLHEKPFKGINGSGKHCNWSLNTDTGALLTAPGKTDKDNLRFITFVVNILSAIYRHNGLLKASVMNASNEHRLGANEAPPAIISSFLGSDISSVLDHMEQSEEFVRLLSKREIKLSIPQIPELLIDNTDRNRTSPFAFTGNRFEFRAVGSEANCSAAMIVLNTAVAEQLQIFRQEVEDMVEKGEEKEFAIEKVLRKYIKYCKPVRFDGNGYSDEWKAEAARRGLDCETSSPLLYDRYLDEDSVKMFSAQGVMGESELRARDEIKWSTYTKKVQIEGRVLGDLAVNHIIPIATAYQSRLLDNVLKMETAFGKEEGDSLSKENLDCIRLLAGHISAIRKKVLELVDCRRHANVITSEREKAIAYHDNVAPMMDEIRYHIDHIELMVDDELWALPKYRELLYI